LIMLNDWVYLFIVVVAFRIQNVCADENVGNTSEAIAIGAVVTACVCVLYAIVKVFKGKCGRHPDEGIENQQSVEIVQIVPFKNPNQKAENAWSNDSEDEIERGPRTAEEVLKDAENDHEAFKQNKANAQARKKAQLEARLAARKKKKG